MGLKIDFLGWYIFLVKLPMFASAVHVVSHMNCYSHVINCVGVKFFHEKLAMTHKRPVCE